MPLSCGIRGCTSRAKKDPYSFFRIPSSKEKSRRVNEKLSGRRELWLMQIGRNDEDKLRNFRICSRHFVSGRPAEACDVNKVDWIPTLHMTKEKPRKFKCHTKKPRNMSESTEDATEILPLLFENENICRTCLKVIKGYNYIKLFDEECLKSYQLRKSLEFVVGNMDHGSILDTVVICLKCEKLIKLCYDFKMQCKEVEENISYVANLMNSKINLRHVGTGVKSGANLEPDIEDLINFYNEKIPEDNGGTQEEIIQVKIEQDLELPKMETIDHTYFSKTKNEKRCQSLSVFSINTDNPEQHYKEKELQVPESFDLFDEEHDRYFSASDYTTDVEMMVKYRNLAVNVGSLPIDGEAMCDKCGVMVEVRKFRGHAAFHRNHDGPYECQLCGKQYKTRKNVEEHERWKHRKMESVVCYVCGKLLENKMSLTGHINKVHKSRFKCRICNKVLKTKKHYERKHPSVVPCKVRYCNEVFNSEALMEEHLNVHKETKRPNVITDDTVAELEGVKCHICSSEFFDQEKLFDHLIEHQAVDEDNLAVFTIIEDGVDGGEEVSD